MAYDDAEPAPKPQRSSRISDLNGISDSSSNTCPSRNQEEGAAISEIHVANSDLRQDGIVDMGTEPDGISPSKEERSVSGALLEKDVILSSAVSFRSLSPSGIYFLIFEEEIVYVGMSTSIVRRISDHIQQGRIKFDSCFFVTYPVSDLEEMEIRYINRFRPLYNRHVRNARPKDLSIQVIGEKVIRPPRRMKPSQPVVISETRVRLNRAEAAVYITEKYFPYSKGSLDKHASNGTGPEYSVVGPNGYGQTFYRREDLDSWCEVQINKPANRKKRDWAERKMATA